MGAHLQHRPAAAAAGRVMAEARVEKAGVMDPEFADPRVIGAHFGGMIQGHGDEFLGSQDVKLVGIEDQTRQAAARPPDRLPKPIDRIGARPVDIDQPGMRFGAVADEPVIALKIDRHRHHGPDQLDPAGGAWRCRKSPAARGASATG